MRVRPEMISTRIDCEIGGIMRVRISTILLSFLAGVCSTLFVFGLEGTYLPYSTVLANDSAALQEAPPPPGMGGPWVHSAIFTGDRTPILRTLGPEFDNAKIVGTAANPAAQILDGLNCKGCTFSNAVLTYSGGAVRLEDMAFTGTTTLRLEGAAANTVALLELWKAINKGLPTAPAVPSKPPVRRATPKPRTRGNFETPPHLEGEPGLTRPNQ